ncbi:hypothetical protein PFL603g_00312 [Pseudomonas fluorescens]|uniref:Uncharacterized protein n=1 Tax=Pseudomonas fluorescens TaxID=294 RepID=A0A109L9M2_PSEFL|nr:hypothetical protein PFL603g_00312 [Pseudomonas fluorescens]
MGQPNTRNGTPLGSSNTTAPIRLTSQYPSGTSGGTQAGNCPASSARPLNNPSSAPPASHSTPSPASGTHNNAVPSSARGSTTRLIHGTANRFATGALRLMGRPSTSNTGNKPMAINHWGRVHACQTLHGPRRPPNASNNTATAANDNQNPTCRLAKGSSTSTPFSASSNGHHSPKWRKRRRHSNTRPTITQARCTGTPNPASRP